MRQVKILGAAQQKTAGKKLFNLPLDAMMDGEDMDMPMAPGANTLENVNSSSCNLSTRFN